ncbi:MAG: hypothetical protein WD767_11435 [Alphaproteobacteria bacterium]
MAGSSGDPVATISEAGATGDIAALYADIRATQGVPVVNLIWRHIAVLPGALGWAWEALKPLYESGLIDAEADRLRNDLTLPALPGMSRSVLLCAGLRDSDIAQIMMVLQSYERSNAMNMVALSALLARIEGAASASRPAVVTGTVRAAIDGAMPPLPGLDDMRPHVRDVVLALNSVGGRTEILASMYRHLANWPPCLGLIRTLIAPVEADGRIEPVIQCVIAEGIRRGAILAGGLASPASVPDATTQQAIAQALRTFIEGPIGKMIAIVPIIRRAMPA